MVPNNLWLLVLVALQCSTNDDEKSASGYCTHRIRVPGPGRARAALPGSSRGMCTGTVVGERLHGAQVQVFRRMSELELASETAP